MAVRSSRRRRPTIDDFIEADAQVVALQSFRPETVSRMVERGTYYRLSDEVVRQWPAMFAILIPVERFLGELEIER